MDAANQPAGIPVNLIYLGPTEIMLVSVVAGAIIGVAYQVGRERQRRWVGKLVAESLEESLKTS